MLQDVQAMACLAAMAWCKFVEQGREREKERKRIWLTDLVYVVTTYIGWRILLTSINDVQLVTRTPHYMGR